MKALPVILIAGMTLAQGAQAICRQADAQGTWDTYQSAFINKNGDPHVGQCLLKADKYGAVDIASSSCKFIFTGFTTANFQTGGIITVNKDCSATINLDLGNFAGQVQLTKTKDSFSGRFTAQDGAVLGTTNGVKR
ncbi:MAG: hypothetical protein RLZZ627_2098 [Pseudomonadota bacterium]|jgi:NADPH-dependent 7-cyano-7-deazaguanine reductase QueF-like protein